MAPAGSRGGGREYRAAGRTIRVGRAHARWQRRRSDARPEDWTGPLGKLYLIRHGEVLWNRERPAYCGVTDLELNPHGRQQARRLADRLAGVNLAAVYCSDLRRAQRPPPPSPPPWSDALPRPRPPRGSLWGLGRRRRGRGPPALARTLPRLARRRGAPAHPRRRNVRRTARPLRAGSHAHPGAASRGERRHRRAQGGQPVFLCAVLGLSPSHYRRIGQDNAALNTPRLRPRPLAGGSAQRYLPPARRLSAVPPPRRQGRSGRRPCSRSSVSGSPPGPGRRGQSKRAPR